MFDFSEWVEATYDNTFVLTLAELLTGKIQTENPSGDLPYHNNAHMCGVMNMALILYDEEKGDVSEEEEMRDKFVIVTASLLHDYGHSGGKLPDSENIEIAIKALKDCEEIGEAIPYYYYPTVMILAENAIRCTQFPFVIEPTTLVEKCIRDADLLEASASMDPTTIMEDLRAEMSVTRGRDITLEEMLEGQKAFLSNVSFYTNYGKSISENVYPKYLELLEQYVEERRGGCQATS